MSDESESAAFPLPPLPNEILSIILSHLDLTHRPSLAVCCRVSHTFFDIASPMLYRRVVIGPDAQKDARRDCDPKAGKGGRINPDTRKSKLLENVTAIRVVHHPMESLCGRAVRLPALHTLRLDLWATTATLHHGAQRLSEEHCSLLQHLRPAKLVIHTGRLGQVTIHANGLQSIRSRPPAYLREAVIVCKPPVRHWYYGPPPTGSIPPSMKRITWIFPSASPKDSWQKVYDNPAPTAVARYDQLDYEMVSLARTIAQAHTLPTLIVNTECIHPTSLPKLLPDVDEAVVRSTFARCLKRYVEAEVRNWSSRRKLRSPDDQRSDEVVAEDKWANIKFMTMREYLAQEDWSGVFEYQEVKAWLETPAA